MQHTLFNKLKQYKDSKQEKDSRTVQPTSTGTTQELTLRLD